MALAQTLASLAPAGGVNRDMLLFRAGQASVRRGWAWPLYAGVSTLALLGLAAILLLRPPQTIVQNHETVIREFVLVPTPAPEPETNMTSVEDVPYPDPTPFLVRREILRHGVDALPDPAPWTSTGTSPSLDGDLSLPPDALHGPWLRLPKTSHSSGDAL
jgi:hypothetical protein